MSDEVDIKIGQMEVARAHTTLIARALGSCVAVAIYDRQNEVGGMAHVLLGRGKKKKKNKPALYADEAIEKLIKDILKIGGKRRNLEAKIAGGADMFSSKSDGAVGKKNVVRVLEELSDRNIKIVGKDTGGNHARNVRFKIGSMSMKVEVKM